MAVMAAVRREVDTHCPYCALQCGTTVGPAGAVPLRHAPAGPVTDSPAQLPARAVICRRPGVTKGELVSAWSDGAREVAALTALTRATTGCGTCADAVVGLCAWLNDADPGPAAVAGEEGAA